MDGLIPVLFDANCPICGPLGLRLSKSDARRERNRHRKKVHGSTTQTDLVIHEGKIPED
jgi:hypothetical protein